MEKPVVLIESEPRAREQILRLLRGSAAAPMRSVTNASEGCILVKSLGAELVLLGTTLSDGPLSDIVASLVEANPAVAITLYMNSADAGIFSEFEHHPTVRGFVLRDGFGPDLIDSLQIVRGGGVYIDRRLRTTAAVAQAPPTTTRLSKRELEIIALLAGGYSGEEIAQTLVLSAETVKTHIRNVMTKLNAHTRAHAVAIAFHNGYIPVSRNAPLWRVTFANQGEQVQVPERVAKARFSGDQAAVRPAK